MLLPLENSHDSGKTPAVIPRSDFQEAQPSGVRAQPEVSKKAPCSQGGGHEALQAPLPRLGGRAPTRPLHVLPLPLCSDLCLGTHVVWRSRLHPDLNILSSDLRLRFRDTRAIYVSPVLSASGVAGKRLENIRGVGHGTSQLCRSSPWRLSTRCSAASRDHWGCLTCRLDGAVVVEATRLT